MSGHAPVVLGLKARGTGLSISIGALVDYDLNKITPSVIAKAAFQGDQITNEIYHQVGQY